MKNKKGQALDITPLHMIQVANEPCEGNSDHTRKLLTPSPHVRQQDTEDNFRGFTFVIKSPFSPYSPSKA